ncbi:MAG TPA: hypothetical protein P5121_18280, partial [Caldilineaceae bacterium]|nr:hypothetical protein [Caldilineaceae bacterium]
TYVDELDVQPHTSVPATELAGSHPVFYSANFFPRQPWQLNYYDFLADPLDGTIRLMVTPTQFQSAVSTPNRGTLRRFTNMQFRIFYSPDTSTAALAAPPTIAHVATTVDGSGVHFTVEVNRSNELADVQEVWVTYSTVNGTTWQSFGLTSNSSNPILWEGTLPGATVSNARFMVQAASATGLVTLDTNQGAYYTPGIDPGAPTPPSTGGQSPAQASTLSFTNVPAVGTFTDIVELTVRLADNNNAALIGQPVSVNLGTQTVLTKTNSSGEAKVPVLLSDRPGDYLLQAAFAGSASYRASTAAQPFTINKQATALTIMPVTLTASIEASATMTATLRDADTRGLRERTVLFVIRDDSNAIVYSKTSITDFQGRAALTVHLPHEGNYSVTAYFGGGSPIPELTLSDAYYEPSSVVGTIVVTAPIAPDTQITGQPDNPSSSSSATFTFIGNSSGALAFQCQLDGAAFMTCTSPQSYDNLADGSHTFAVRAVDGANNVDPTPAAYTWTVQAAPGELIGSCGGYAVYRTPQGQFIAPNWNNDILVGTSGDDNLKGTSGSQLILGLGGNDTLKGGSKDDILCGGEGNDDLDGGSGADQLYGGNGNDKLSGGSSDDQLDGGAGSDQLDGGAGDDVVRGGADNDQLSGGSGHDQLDGGTGNDQLDGGAGNDQLNGGAGDDELKAGAGNDILTGGIGADKFSGDSGNDRAIDLNPGEGDVNQGGIELFGPQAAARQADDRYLAPPANQIFLPMVSR